MSEFLFSVVMAIYNSDEYLTEAIDSIILQDIGFEENIQLILVDDGSSDSSGKIMNEYKKSFPDNIICLHKENGGPASARNLGLQYVSGKYVNFLDSDDKLSLNAFSRVYEFFLNNDINLVSVPIFYFGRKTGNQYMNYRFKKEQIIDLNEIIDFPEFSASSCFIKYEALKDLKFNEHLINGEDLIFINKILLNSMSYGLLNSVKYFYRKRLDYSSLMDHIYSSERFFTEKLVHCFKNLIDYSLREKGEVPKFIQYAIVQDLHGIIKSKNFTVFVNTKEKRQEFNRYLEYILEFIDEDVILAQRNLSEHAKSFLIYVKNNYKFDIELNGDELVLKTKDHVINNTHNNKIKIQDISIRRRKIRVSGYILTCCNNDYFHLTVNDYSIADSEMNDVQLSFLGIPWLFYKEFKFEIPFVSQLEFNVIYNENNNRAMLKNNVFFYEGRRSSRIIRNNQIILFNGNKIILVNNSINHKLKVYSIKILNYITRR